jgi:hypothetical protein
VAAQQPEVMAQGAAKAAGRCPLKPTKYTMDDFQVGQHVGGQIIHGHHVPGSRDGRGGS